MSAGPDIFLGIDSGATTCKVNGVNTAGQMLSAELRQSPTRSHMGKAVLMDDWLTAAQQWLDQQGLTWDQVRGLGLALPGPFEKSGVLGALPNYPPELHGWHYLDDFRAHLRQAIGRDIPLATANDGHLAALAEARLIQAEDAGSVFLLAPGSGLGSGFVTADGQLQEGDHLSAAFFCCMPLPYAELGLPKLPCTCGRDWGCAEGYCALSGLPGLIRHVLPAYPDHPFHRDASSPREQALSLRRLAQEHDPLALAVFDLQARAMGIVVAMASMAYDPTHIVIGGGLMDPDATTPAFRQHYLDGILAAAAPRLWISPDRLHLHPARLGEHAQAVGAALRAKGNSGGDSGGDSGPMLP